MAARAMRWRLNAAKRGPIVASVAVGVGHSPVRESGFSGSRSDVSLAMRVRNDEDSITEVIGANGCRWNAIPFRIIPARGQVSEYNVQPSRKQRCDVLHDDEAWSKLANDPGKFSPQAGTFAFNSGSLSCIANVLAGEASADEIDRWEVVSSDLSHVSESDCIWPVSFKDLCRIVIHLYLPDCSHPCSLKPKLQAADTGKKRADSQHCFPLPHSGQAFR